MDVIGPLSTAPFSRSILPLHSRGQRVPDSEFPNSESGMGYGPVHNLWARFIRVGHGVSHLVGHWVS
jgi:hypothetical protein